MANFKEHVRGVMASNMIKNYLLKKGYQVLEEDQSQGLVDLFAINYTTGDSYLIDCKCLSRRATTTAGGTKGARVNRVLKAEQKDLAEKSGIPFILAYAEIDTGIVEIPKLL